MVVSPPIPGTVTDEAGNPVEGAKVFVVQEASERTRHNEDKIIFTTKTDVNGDFTLPDKAFVTTHVEGVNPNTEEINVFAKYEVSGQTKKAIPSYLIQEYTKPADKPGLFHDDWEDASTATVDATEGGHIKDRKDFSQLLLKVPFRDPSRPDSTFNDAPSRPNWDIMASDRQQENGNSFNRVSLTTGKITLKKYSYIEAPIDIPRHAFNNITWEFEYRKGTAASEGSPRVILGSTADSYFENGGGSNSTLRHTPNKGYQVLFADYAKKIRLSRMNESSSSILSGWSYTDDGVWKKMKVEFQDGTWTFYLNGTQLGTVQEDTYPLEGERFNVVGVMNPENADVTSSQFDLKNYSIW